MNEASLGGFFRDGVHVLPIRVYFEDTDFSGVVYHANYLKYFERGRSDCLRLMGVSHRDLFSGENPIAWTITRMEIDFLKPASIDDALEVHTAYTKITGVRLFAGQLIKRDGEDLVRVGLEAACITPAGKPGRIPKAVRGAIELHLATV